MKEIVGIGVLISYPNFSEEFIICMDGSKTLTAGVIIQNRKTSVAQFGPCTNKLYKYKNITV